jgi:hypothetical protein
MTGLVRKAALLSVGGLLLAASAMASIPSPANCTVPCGIALVGNNSLGTVADPAGQFSVVIRDVGNAPLAGVVVTVDLSGCCNDIKLGTTQLGAGVSVNVATKQVSVTTDVTGTAVFRVQGGASSVPTGPRPGLATPTAGAIGCAKIYANATLITDGISKPVVSVAAYDLNGALTGGSGVGGPDLSLYLDDFFSGGAPYLQYRQRADYDRPVVCLSNGANVVAGPDLSKWLSVFLPAASVKNAAAFTACP